MLRHCTLEVKIGFIQFLMFDLLTLLKFFYVANMLLIRNVLKFKVDEERQTRTKKLILYYYRLALLTVVLLAGWNLHYSNIKMAHIQQATPQVQ